MAGKVLMTSLGWGAAKYQMTNVHVKRTQDSLNRNVNGNPLEEIRFRSRDHWPGIEAYHDEKHVNNDHTYGCHQITEPNAQGYIVLVPGRWRTEFRVKSRLSGVHCGCDLYYSRSSPTS